MQITIGLGLGLAPSAPSGQPPAPTTLTLDVVISPAAPVVGDLVTLTGNVTGDPLPADFASLTVTIAGVAVLLAGSGLVRTFVAQAGALAVSASVTTVQGTVNDTLTATIAAGTTVASIIGFGSSSTEGTGATSTARRYLNLIGAAMGAGTIRNSGLAGTVLQNTPDASGTPRPSNGRDRFATDLLGANKSDRCYLLHGSNDLRYTGAPATFNVTAYGIDMREVVNGLLLGGYTQGEIVIGSPNWYPDVTYTIGGVGFTGSNRTIHEQYVAEVAAIALEYGIGYADVYARMRDLGGLALTDTDNLHPNDAGHQVIAHAFLTAAVTNARTPVTVGAASSPAAQQLSLAWSAVAGAIDYTVQAGISGTYGFPLTATMTGLSNLFTGLAAGAYVGRVRANFAGGPGPWRFFTTPVVVAAVGGPTYLTTGEVSFVGQTVGTLAQDVPEISGTLVRHPASTGQAAIATGGNALRGPGSNGQFAVVTIDDEAIGAGVFVELDYLIQTNNAQLTAYAVARANAASLNFVGAGYNGSAWRILKFTGGTATILATFALVEAVGATPTMRLEVESGVQRLYRNNVLVTSSAEPDSGFTTLGDGLGVRMGSGTAAWSSVNGPQITGMRVGRIVP